MEAVELQQPHSIQEQEPLCILIIGKTGNGKSTVGNALLGKQVFQVGVGLSSTTKEASLQESSTEHGLIQVIDTPDIFNSGLCTKEEQIEVEKWRKLASQKPHIILVAIRCDVRYTAEEHNIYLQIKRLWGDNSFCEKLVVLFTFGDRQDRDLEDELKTVCPELKSLLEDAKNRYIMYSMNKDTEKDLISLLKTKLNQDQTQNIQIWTYIISKIWDIFNYLRSLKKEK